MKKALIIILSLALMLTFAACGEKNGGKSPSESSAPAESGNTPSSKAGADEKEFTMKYDQLFDTVFFRFTVE